MGLITVCSSCANTLHSISYVMYQTSFKFYVECLNTTCYSSAKPTIFTFRCDTKSTQIIRVRWVLARLSLIRTPCNTINIQSSSLAFWEILIYHKSPAYQPGWYVSLGRKSISFVPVTFSFSSEEVIQQEQTWKYSAGWTRNHVTDRNIFIFIYLSTQGFWKIFFWFVWTIMKQYI